MDNQNTGQKPVKTPQKIVGMLMLEAGIEFAVLIAAPLLLAVYFGPKLDQKFHSGHILVVVCILVALAVSAFAIYVRILDYQKILKQSGPDKH